MGKLMKSRPVYKRAHLTQWSLEYQSTRVQLSTLGLAVVEAVL